jgi:hypothetical protein
VNAQLGAGRFNCRGKQPHTGQDCHLVIKVSWRVRNNDVEGAAQRGMRSSVELEEKRGLGYVKQREPERIATTQRALGPDPLGYPSRVVGGDRRIRAAHCDARGRTRYAQDPR